MNCTSHPLSLTSSQASLSLPCCPALSLALAVLFHRAQAGPCVAAGFRFCGDVSEAIEVSGLWGPGEIFPCTPAPVLLDRFGIVETELYNWGFQGPSKVIINARAETATEKPMFRDSVERMRCVVPCSAFFEWDSQKRKYLFTLPGDDTLFMAGLYTNRYEKPSYVILTTDANASMREVHHRMPLVLKRDQVTPWLMEAGAAKEFLRMTPPLLDRVAADTQISLW